ncbi:MAG: hypothetical protein Alis3KO_15800 [Aliiglaciecola sp.]
MKSLSKPNNSVAELLLAPLMLLYTIFLVVALMTTSFEASAEPYLAVKNNLKCSACHVNPIGGGLRNSFGNIYGHTQLPVDVSDFTSAEIGKITDFVSVGGNLRYNGQFSEDDADQDSATFRVDSAQVYVAITPKDSGLTLYLDQQIAPGAAVNREAYIQYQFSGQHYIKAGKMYVPYGLRLEDDTAFVRQVTGFNFDSSDNGIELGLEYNQATVNLFVTNGTSSVSNNDDKFLYGIKAEKLFSGFRLGGTAVINTADENEERLWNLYGGAVFGDFTFLTEINLIQTEQNSGPDLEEFVGLAEVNYQWRKGWNFKLTGEYYDPDRSFPNNHETRYSLIVEYAPVSNIQLRAGLRSSEGIPQQPNRTGELFFLQSHVYF